MDALLVIVVAVVVVLVIGVLSLCGAWNWRKNQRLTQELDVAELQLNRSLLRL